MSTRPSVILVRMSAEPMGGCCRVPHSSVGSTTADPAFASHRAIIDRMGAVYQALRERFGRAIDVQVIDARNVALPILLIQDFFAHHVGFRDGLRTLAQIPQHAVIVNGRIVDESDAPDAPAIVAHVAAVADVTRVRGLAATAPE
jgi:hypothetical protein